MIFSRRITISMVLFSVVLFIAGCAPVSFLKKDSLGKDNGLIMLHLRIKDSSRKLFRTVPELFIGQQDSAFVTSIYMGPDEGKWLGEDMRDNRYWNQAHDANYFDQYYFIEGEPGRFFIKSLIMEYGTLYSTKYYFDLPLSIACNLTQNGLVVGTVDIIVDAVEGDYPNYKISYRSELGQTDSDRESILERFKDRYPMVSKTYLKNGIIGKAFIGFYENFTLSGKHARWESFNSETFAADNHGAYKLSSRHSDKNNHGYVSMKNKMNLPGNYTISYKIRWNEGMRDAFYGLRLAKDADNVYYFGVTADGSPVIWIKKNGEWQADPEVGKPAMFMASKKTADNFSIEVLNNRVVYKINGETAGIFTGVLELSKAHIGFYVSGKQNIEVDLFELIEKHL